MNTSLTFTLGERTINRVGYGAMQLAGPGVFGPPKDRDGALAVLREAVESGVNHLDTSDFYGPHVTNGLIREALHPYPDDLLLVTKIGAKRGEDASWLPALAPEELKRAVHDNLRNLGLEALEVVNLRLFGGGAGHGPAEGSLEEPLAALVELQGQGLVRHIGLSNVTKAQVSEGRRLAKIVCVQNHYNLAHREDDALIDHLAAENIAYVPFFPLGGFSPLQSSALSDVAARLGATPMQIALAWLLHRAPNILLIPGTSSIGHLRENLAAAQISLPDSVIAELDTIGKRLDRRAIHPVEHPHHSMKKVLIIGASGFVGRRVAQALIGDEFAVRCLARDPDKVRDLATLGCEVVRGDISDAASVEQALEGVEAVYIAIHTISPQPANTAKQRFMAVEMKGLQNIIEGCHAQGVRRLISVTSLGIAATAPSEWLRERWRGEQLLLNSGLDVTIIRPGMIVGAGGRGFEMLAGQAKNPVAIFLGGGQKMRSIALDDLIFYLLSVLDDSRAYGQCYDVGNDDVLSNSQMVDIDADIFGRRHPLKFGIPLAFLKPLAPLIERAGKLPTGAFKGLIESLRGDGSGDPTPIRLLLPRQLLSYRQAAERAITK